MVEADFKKILHTIMATTILLLCFTACHRNAHEDEFPIPDHLPTLRLLLKLPEPKLPDYVPQVKSRTADAGYLLRCVAELRKAGTDQLILRKPATPSLQADGTYLVELATNEGFYDLSLWTDYARTTAPLADTYYHTENLKAVVINTHPYVANTDSKDAAYACRTNLSLPAEGAETKVELQRPLAKYRLVATDAEEYRKLMAEDETEYPPLEQLTVKVTYEGFFPSSFNVSTEKPNGAVNGSEIIYSQILPHTADADKEVEMGSDWVLVNGTESFITVTIRIERSDGKVVSEKSGVRIDYRRGYLTTVKGKFLTAGHTGGGIHIDTGWEGTYEVKF